MDFFTGNYLQGQIKGHLGQVEVEDQVAGLEHVASTYGIIDMKRVAIEGWSYGGFMSLMALAKRSDIFKVFCRFNFSFNS